MSTKAYHTYGYGICVEKIKNVEKDKLLSLIRMAPEINLKCLPKNQKV